MSDNPHHPGVRSLLAKFENQSPIASPPSRGRSPAASDSSGTARQLSKVRASFVTVDGVIQSNPASPLRKTSGRSDSPGIFGPKINSEQTESGRQTMASPTPPSHQEHTQNATLGRIMADGRPDQGNETKGQSDQSAKEIPTTPTETAPKLDPTPEKTEKDVSVRSKSATSDTPSQNSDSSAKAKKSSPLGPARSAASKPKVTAAPSAKPASNTHPKPSAREVAKERSNSLAHKPSRVSLNPKTTARSTRGATPAQDTSKPTGASAPTRSGVQSPARPARATGSTAASTQSSSGKLGSTGAPSTRSATSSTLHRKPSTLKSAVGNQHATAPTTVRRQASRPSLPAQPAGDAHTKPVNEGFLARMMRPTASSASKLSQEKADSKPAAKTTTAHRAPRPSVGRTTERGTSEAKPKSTLRPHGEKSQALNKGLVPQKNGPKPPQKKQESEKENIAETTNASPKEPVLAKPAQVVVTEQPEATAKSTEEKATPVQVEESVPEAAVESNEKPTELAEPIVEETPVEAPTPAEEPLEVPVKTEAVVESIPEVVEENSGDKAATEEAAEPSPAQPKEAVEEPVANSELTSNDDSKVSEKQEAIATEPESTEVSKSVEPPVEVSEKKEETPEPAPLEEPTQESTTETETAEVKPAKEVSADVQSKEPAPAVQHSSEAESSNVALDITNLALH
ncbi:unnamed protein product [Penicillium salamii]|nr:unnamed protein product [Penicillium salamii]